MSREEIISLIVRVVIVVLASLIGRYVIPYIRTSVGDEKLALIKKWALIFVNSAENIIKGEKKGDEKRQVVTEWIATKANEIGISMTVDDVRSVLEDAYNTMINESKSVEEKQ